MVLALLAVAGAAVAGSEQGGRFSELEPAWIAAPANFAIGLVETRAPLLEVALLVAVLSIAIFLVEAWAYASDRPFWKGERELLLVSGGASVLIAAFLVAPIVLTLVLMISLLALLVLAIVIVIGGAIYVWGEVDDWRT